MKNLFTSFLLFLFFPIIIEAQIITGHAVDAHGNGVGYVSVAMQKLDSTYLCATITDSTGAFTLSKAQLPCRLVFQHISYKAKIITCQKYDVGDVALTEQTGMLSEVTVKGERPVAKVSEGMLDYNLSMLVKNRPVDNAYDAIKELPGVSEKDGKLELAGSSSLAVIINGKPSTMTYDQLMSLLKSMPVGSVEKAEITYAAPPKFHVRGAAINVVLKNTKAYSMQGEIRGRYSQSTYASALGTTNLRLTSPKMSLDLMYSGDESKTLQEIGLTSLHTLNGVTHDIQQHQRIVNNGFSNNMRAAFQYNFSDKSNLEIAWTGEIDPHGHNRNTSVGTYQNSEVNTNGKSQMNNASLKYVAPFGLTIGGDYTNYHSTGTTNFLNKAESGEQTFNTVSGQHVERMNFYADQEHELNHEWTLGYGVSYANTYDRDWQLYRNVTGDIATADTKASSREQTTDFYVSASKSFKGGQSLEMSASGEYYTIGNYHKWAFYPQASFTYFKKPEHVFVLSLSSDKTFPSYWSRQSSVSYIDGYSIVIGNPDQKPSSSYALTATYLYKQKYSFTLFHNMTFNYLNQIGYQSKKQLNLIYFNPNWNHSYQSGLDISAPFTINSWFETRAKATVLLMNQKCDKIEDIPFDRKHFATMISDYNTFTVNKHLSFTLDGSYTTGVIQGPYDILDFYNVDVGMRWSFLKDKAVLSVKGVDLFQTSTPDTKVRYGGQHFDMDDNFDNRTLAVSFIYRFGGYKEKQHKEVDTSRFGH
jgi:hypothetical protein